MVSVKWSALKETKPHEYAVRFIFGGMCTVVAGWVSKHFGPAAGGLFLAFPAIFPATASLIETHEKERKHRAGMHGTMRGRQAAGLDAMGTSLSAIGLIGFAAVVWLMIPNHEAAAVIAAATVIWALVSLALWGLRRHGLFRFSHKPE